MPFKRPSHVRSVEIGKIDANVEQLDTDDDYGMLAQKVGENIYDEMMKGTPAYGFQL